MTGRKTFLLGAALLLASCSSLVALPFETDLTAGIPASYRSGSLEVPAGSFPEGTVLYIPDVEGYSFSIDAAQGTLRSATLDMELTLSFGGRSVPRGDLELRFLLVKGNSKVELLRTSWDFAQNPAKVQKNVSLSPEALDLVNSREFGFMVEAYPHFVLDYPGTLTYTVNRIYLKGTAGL